MLFSSTSSSTAAAAFHSAAPSRPFFSLLLLGCWTLTSAQNNYTLESIPKCTLSSLELAELGLDADVEPCMFDIQPTPEVDDNGNTSSTTVQILPLVQVTPHVCGDHRDGAMIAVELINQEGIPLGYQRPTLLKEAFQANNMEEERMTRVKFRLVSVVAGNPIRLGFDNYVERHGALLDALVRDLQAPYIIGTCELFGEVEMDVAQRYQSILMAQIEQQSFYERAREKDYVFGMAINSAEYPLAAVQQLVVWSKSVTATIAAAANDAEGPLTDSSSPGAGSSTTAVLNGNHHENFPIRIITSTDNDVFADMCNSVLAKLTSEGFGNVQQVFVNSTEEFVLSQTEDINANDPKVQERIQELRQIADDACPPPPVASADSSMDGNTHDGSAAGDERNRPAMFLCMIFEQDIIFDRWLETGCRPTSIWLSAANNYPPWTMNNPHRLPYIQSGGPWHPTFDYSDEHFASGQALLDFAAKRFGLVGTFEMVEAYSIPMLFQQHLQATYRLDETSTVNPLADFATPEGRERLRRAMTVLTADTLWGPVVFDDVQRNIGRSAAGTQFLPEFSVDMNLFDDDLISGSFQPIQMSTSGDEAAIQNITYVSRLVSPQLQAEANILLSTTDQLLCPPGAYWNEQDWAAMGALLARGCQPCPVDTFSPVPTFGLTQCRECPEGSHTDDMVGAELCIVQQENLVSKGVLGFGYFAVALSWSLSIFFLGWIYKNRKHHIVTISQRGFLALICIGAMISSSTIIPLSFQAGMDEDTSQATRGCRVAPFVYTIGWILQYSSLSAKTYRLYKIMQNSKKANQDEQQQQQTQVISFRSTLTIVIVALAIDMAIVISATVVNPFEYKREEIDRTIDLDEGTLTIESSGGCRLSEAEPSIWAFLPPLAIFHLCLITICNVLLLKVRKFTSRYQEFKYMMIAMILMAEVILIGIPVLFAVRDNPSMLHIIVTFAVVFHDITIMICIFFPKVYYKDKKTNKDHGESVILASFQSMGQTKWDQSLDVISRLCEPGSKTRKAMTDSQVMELESVKALLIQGLQGESNREKLVHLPASLASRISKSASVSSTIRADDNEIRYILREYAGLTTAMTRSMMFGMSSITEDTVTEDITKEFEREIMNDYLLPEFEGLTPEQQEDAFELLSWEKLKDWNFNIFELLEVTGGNPLVFVGWAVLGSPYAQYSMALAIGKEGVTLADFAGYHYMDSSLKIPMKKLCDYLRVIQEDYRPENPYHNEIHAADVVQTLHALIQMMMDTHTITEEQSFAALLAAAVHDVNHPGKNNSFQVNAKTGLAIMYNDVSVLENRHATHAFMKMFGKDCLTGDEMDDADGRNDDINPLCNLSTEKFQKIRTMIVNAVLHTDMSKHFHTVSAMKNLYMTEAMKTSNTNVATGAPPTILPMGTDTVWKTLEYMIHLADISNPAKADPMFKLWTDRCLAEFFAQGDRELQLGLPVSPNCDRRTTKRAESQIGFIRYVILPAYEVLASVLPNVKDTVLPVITSNLVYWDMDAIRAKKQESLRNQSATRSMCIGDDCNDDDEVDFSENLVAANGDPEEAKTVVMANGSAKNQDDVVEEDGDEEKKS